MKLLLVILSLSSGLLAQGATGKIVFTPPTPGNFVATANPSSSSTVSCTVTGNAAPATAVIINCTVGSTAIPSYSVPLPAGTSYTFSQGFNGDSVTVSLTSNSSGIVSWNATASPNGGTSQNSSGTL